MGHILKEISVVLQGEASAVPSYTDRVIVLNERGTSADSEGLEDSGKPNNHWHSQPTMNLLPFITRYTHAIYQGPRFSELGL